MMKLADPDYHVTNRRTGSRTKSVELYSTNCNPGRLIRNPMTGIRTNDKVGSLAEYKYFRIRMTTICDGIDPVTLYYDSPDTYERHMHTKLSRDIKKKWRANCGI